LLHVPEFNLRRWVRIRSSGSCGTLFGPRQQNHCTVEISFETPEISDLSGPKEGISDIPEDSDVI
jgi:hypothetical protein